MSVLANRLALVATLAVACAVLLLGDARPTPRLVATAADGAVRVENSRADQAILTATDLRPGQSTTGTLTLSNRHPQPHALTLATVALSDDPGAGGGKLSERLDLVVERVESGAPVRVFAGKLGTLSSLSLGEVAGGSAVTYRFTASLPEGGPTLDNPYAGAQVDVKWSWRADGPADDPPPATEPPVESPGSPAQPAAPEKPPVDRDRSDAAALGAPSAVPPVRLWVGGGRLQRVSAGQRSTGAARRAAARKPVLLVLLARCRPSCAVEASARARIGLGWLRFRTRRLGRAEGGRTARLAFVLSRGELRALMPLLTDRRRLRVQVDVQASAPGRSTAATKRAIELRR